MIAYWFAVLGGYWQGNFEGAGNAGFWWSSTQSGSEGFRDDHSGTRRVYGSVRRDVFVAAIRVPVGLGGRVGCMAYALAFCFEAKAKYEKKIDNPTKNQSYEKFYGQAFHA